MEYVKSAGATNNEGPTDTLYREGLDNYWNQYYSAAIPKFEEVKRLFPQHSEVDRLVQSSQQAKAEGKEKPDAEAKAKKPKGKAHKAPKAKSKKK